MVLLLMLWRIYFVRSLIAASSLSSFKEYEVNDEYEENATLVFTQNFTAHGQREFLIAGWMTSETLGFPVGKNLMVLYKQSMDSCILTWILPLLILLLLDIATIICTEFVQDRALVSHMESKSLYNDCTRVITNL